MICAAVSVGWWAGLPLAGSPSSLHSADVQPRVSGGSLAAGGLSCTPRASPTARQPRSHSTWGNAPTLSPALAVPCTNIPQTNLRTEPGVKGGTGPSHPHSEQEGATGYTAKGVDMGVEALIQPVSCGIQKWEELDHGGSQIRLDRAGSGYQARQRCPLQMTRRHSWAALWASSPALSHRVLSLLPLLPVTWLLVAVHTKPHPSSVS